MKIITYVIITALLLTLPAFAAQIVFNTTEGNWNVPGNWSPASVPGSADQPIIPAGRTAIINTDVGQCDVIFCGQSASSPRWGKIQMRPGGKLSAPILILGRDEDNHGIFWLCGGELSLSAYLNVGDNDGGPAGSTASGTLNLSAGSLKMPGTAATYVGYKGLGKMTVSGNGAFYANDITIGENSGSEGSEMKIIGGSVIAGNIAAGGASTSNGMMTISGGSLVWSNLFYVRDTLAIQNGSPSISGVQSGGTSLYLDNSSTLEFEFGADGIAGIKMTNSLLHITSGAKLNINGTYYTRASGTAKSFLLIKHNGYADQTTFTGGNVTFSGFSGLIPSLRYENNCIYLDLTADSGSVVRAAQGIYMKYWELPINGGTGTRPGKRIDPPLTSMPLFTNTIMRTHPTFGKRVKKIDLSDIFRTENIIVQFEGYINILTNGSYTFYLNSDDGSKLWINDSLLVDNDGQHGATEVSASITLTNGMHKLEIGYFQNTGPMVFEVNWSGPGISKQEIPEDVLCISDVKSSCSFQNIIPDQDLYYNYCPSFMYDEAEGLYKIWSGGAPGSGGDYIYYKESPTLEGLLEAKLKYVFEPSHDPSKFDDEHACDPNVFVDTNGVFYLTYSGNTRGSILFSTTRIGMAISYDRGRSWTRLHNGEHILAPAPGFDPTSYGVGQSAVVQANDGYYYMIYTDVDNYRTNQALVIRVIRCSDPAFPTNKHEMINPDVPNTRGCSLDLAYDSSNEEFIVITDISYNPYAKVQLAYYDKNWNYLRRSTIETELLWAFGEGVGLLSDTSKEIVLYSDHGNPSLVPAAATQEYQENTYLWAPWVEGDTKYIVFPENNLIIPYQPPASFDNHSFEMGSYTNWTQTGAAWESQPRSTPRHNQPCDSSFYADSIFPSESAIGTLQSGPFTLKKDEQISFYINGWSKWAGGGFDYNYVTLNRIDDDSELDRAWTPNSDQAVIKTLSHGLDQDVEVYVKAVDNGNTAGYAWLAVDDFDKVEYNNYLGKNNGFEVGDYSGWTVSGPAFGSAPKNYVGGGSEWHGRYFATSIVGGESATGTFRSADFPFGNGSTIQFSLAGWLSLPGGAPTYNYIALKRSSNGSIVEQMQPPNQDIFVERDFTYIGAMENMYIEVIDNCTSNGFAWIAVDDFRLDIIPEPAILMMIILFIFIFNHGSRARIL